MNTQRDLSGESVCGGRWWVCTDILARGGRKVLGPFESQELALRCRELIEKAEGHEKLWVDEEAEHVA
jgi:hypothetical protein